MAPLLKLDAVEMRRALNLLRVYPDQVTELRVLDAKLRGSYQAFTFSGYFNDVEAFIREACRVDSAKGYYTTLNPCQTDLLARRSNRADRAGRGETTKDSEIPSRVWLPIDLDATRPAGISATDDEHEAALDRAKDVAAYLKSQGWPDPIFGDSGNGGHLLYRIDLPRDDGGIVERCMKALDQRFSDDKVKVDTSVFNPARIWKLYGTPVCKGDSTPERPHRMARIIEVPSAN